MERMRMMMMRDQPSVKEPEKRGWRSPSMGASELISSMNLSREISGGAPRFSREPMDENELREKELLIKGLVSTSEFEDDDEEEPEDDDPSEEVKVGSLESEKKLG